MLSIDAKRILLWLYQQEQSGDQTKKNRTHAPARIYAALGLPPIQGKLALGSIANRYIQGLQGELDYAVVYLTPEGYALAEAEFRKGRLARNLSDEARRAAWAQHERTISAAAREWPASTVFEQRNMAIRYEKAEEAYIHALMDAVIKGIADVVHLGPEEEILRQAQLEFASEVEAANLRLKSVPYAVPLDLDQLANSMQRKVAIALDRGAVGNERGQAQVIIGSQTNITTGSHSQVIGTAQTAVQIQTNTQGEFAELVSAVDTTLSKLASLSIPAVDRESTRETLVEMKEEAQQPAPRKGFLRWCLDRFPASVRTLADIAKITEVVVKLSTPPSP